MIQVFLDLPLWEQFLIVVIVLILSFLGFKLFSFLFNKIMFKEKKLTISEPVILPAKLGDYVEHAGDRLFFSAKSERLAIRTIEVFNRKSEDKDKIIFATSLAHRFTEKDKQHLLLLIPQLTDLDFSKSHELLISKSPAVYFFNLQADILRALFIHLDNTYNWITEKQVVKISYDKDSFDFTMKLKIKDHPLLQNSLLDISGVTRLSLNEEDQDNFSLGTSQPFGKILPQVKEIFTNYFKVGVEFTLSSK